MQRHNPVADTIHTHEEVLGKFEGLQSGGWTGNSGNGKAHTAPAVPILANLHVSDYSHAAPFAMYY